MTKTQKIHHHSTSCPFCKCPSTAPSLVMDRRPLMGRGPVRGPEAPISEPTLFGAPVVVLRSSGVLARCSARARRVTPYGPLEGPTTYKLSLIHI